MKIIKFFGFFLPLISFAQEDFGKLYYPEINKAELAYIQDDYQAAFTHYTSAFVAVKKPLARDIFNAVVCKFLLKDFEGAKPLLLKLAQKGIAAEDLEKKEVFQIEGIKAEWANYRFVYEQFYSIIEEKKDQDFIENINIYLNDILVLYSDGITEAANTKFEFYEEQRLMTIIKKHKDKTPKEIALGILEDVIKFSKNGSYLMTTKEKKNSPKLFL